MAKKETLPTDVHDHFRRANVLHGYAKKEYAEIQKHALEIGTELLAAKKTIPHGRWEEECDRLFDGSARTARFYMQFAKDVSALPKRQASAVLLLDGTLDGAAKAAKKVTNPPKKRKPKKKKEEDAAVGTDAKEQPSRTPENGTDSSAGQYGKCPNCAGEKWDEDEDGDVSCSKCYHPHGEPAGDVDEGQVTTLRQKTVKTLGAALRAFDDLQHICPKPEHEGAIAGVKALLKIAKAWK